MARILEIWRLLNAPCEDMTRLTSKAMDATLPFWERFAVKLHLLYCRACRRYKEHLLLLREAMRRAGEQAAAGDDSSATFSAEARERIRRALRDA